MDVVGSAALGWLFAGLIAGAYGVTVRFLPDRRTSVRLCATFIFLVWELMAGFLVLSALEWFRLLPALGLATLAGAAALGFRDSRRRFVAALRRDARNARGLWSVIGWPSRALLLGALSLVVLVLARSFVSPPLAWDDLTYHLNKSGSWVHAGHLVSQARPDGWSFYDYYPATGEVLWAWLLLAGRSGTFLGLGSVAVWLTCFLASYTSARSLSCNHERSLLAASAITFVPAVAVFADTSHVDNVLLAGFLIGFVFLLEARRKFSWCVAFASLTGFALMAGVKLPALLLLALGAVWLGFYAFTGPTGAARRTVRGAATLVAAVVLASVVAAPWYVRALVDHDNPVYPAELSIGGTKLEGNPLWIGIVQGRSIGISPQSASPETLAENLSTAAQSLTRSTFDLNWQPFPLFYVVLAGIGAVTALRTRRRRGPALFLLAAVGLALVQLVSPEMTVTMQLYTLTIGRLFLPALAAFVLLAITVTWGWRGIGKLWYLLVALQLVISEAALLRAWGYVSWSAVGRWLLWSLPFLAVAAVGLAYGLRRRRVHRPRTPAWARGLAVGLAALALLAVFGPVVEHVRSDYRYRAYRSRAEGTSFRLHPTRVGEACSWPIWRAVDQDRGRVIDATFGWRPPEGDNQVQYPFLGSRLQNDVIYVPITADGKIQNYANPAVEQFLDADAWLARLKAEHVEYLAVMPPPVSPESEVVADRPDVFREVAKGSCRDRVRKARKVYFMRARLYRVDTDRIAPGGSPQPAP